MTDRPVQTQHVPRQRRLVFAMFAAAQAETLVWVTNPGENPSVDKGRTGGQNPNGDVRTGTPRPRQVDTMPEPVAQRKRGALWLRTS